MDLLWIAHRAGVDVDTLKIEILVDPEFDVDLDWNGDRITTFCIESGAGSHSRLIMASGELRDDTV
jgi:hypothetical protein